MENQTLQNWANFAAIGIAPLTVIMWAISWTLSPRVAKMWYYRNGGIVIPILALAFGGSLWRTGWLQPQVTITLGTLLAIGLSPILLHALVTSLFRTFLDQTQSKAVITTYRMGAKGMRSGVEFLLMDGRVQFPPCCRRCCVNMKGMAQGLVNESWACPTCGFRFDWDGFAKGPLATAIESQAKAEIECWQAAA